ncbi:MAG TPA: hypothetical protein VEO00_09840 [Actinomycetota bacterium]|nr:hypothetical protein [Actinomycetota bacterium]
MTISGVYRTERGTIWRLVHLEGGSMRVELLTNETWVPGPIAMAGLRLSIQCKELTAAAIRKLPP